MSDIEWYERKFSVEIVFPAAQGADLTDPTTRRKLSPKWVRLELTRRETPDDDGPACVLDPTDDKTDAERRLDRYRDRHPDAVLVQRTVTYGGWTDATEAGTR